MQFDRLGTADGLSMNTVPALLQDRTGFLWVGTETGLDRYDGHTFVHFRHDPDDKTTLSSSFAAALAQTRDGAIWVGTYGGGLNRLDPASGRATRYRHAAAPASLADDRVEALLVDRRGRLWAGTGDGIDLVGRDGTFRHLGPALRAAADVKDGVYVRDLAEAPNGDLWAATASGLFRVDAARGRVRLFLGADALGPDAAMALTVDRDGTVWAGLDGGGLARVDSRTGAVTRLRHDPADAGSLCGDAVHDVLRDRAGVLWAATRGGGVCRLDPAESARAGRPRFAAYRADAGDARSLSTDEARSLYADRGGVVWVGTWGGGLNRMRRTPFEWLRMTPAAGFASSDVAAFADAGRGELWVGTYDGGLFRVDAAGRRLATPGLPAALREAGVRGLAVDRAGAIWATGDPAGLWRRASATASAARWTRVPFPPDAGITRATRLAVGPDGTVWMSAYGPGLCRVAPAARPAARPAIDCPATRFPAGRRLAGTEGYTVFPEADGTVWVSLWGRGADRVDPERGVVAHVENDPARSGSLSQNTVTSFARDRAGRLWLGIYGGGLNRFVPGPDGGSFLHLGVARGLPDETVYSLTPDRTGALWVTTNRGLARLDPATSRVTTFGTEDGLQGDEFNGGAALALADGRILAGGLHGFNRFDPARVVAAGPPPPLAVTAVRVMGLPRPPRPSFRLNHDETAVAFEVAALDFAAPARNRYAFRLDGLDAAWTPAGPRREAVYTNLAPGRYTLRVRAASAAGAVAGMAVPFEIRPAWWQSWPFRGALALAGLLALVAGVRFASQRPLRAEVARLDAERRIQDERGRISRDLHDHVGAQLSSLLAGVELARLARRHPPRDAAGIAAGTTAATPDPLAPDALAADPLAAVEADARETMVQLRESIWALHETGVTLGALRERLDADLRQRLRGRTTPAATVTLDAPADTVLGPEQALHLYRIAREAVTNSLKHAGAARLDVRIATAGGALVVEVRDDGRFRVPAGGDGIGGINGDGLSGYGLDSMRMRAAALGARFDVETDGGTTVRVTVPPA